MAGFADYQTEIYLNGLADQVPAVTTDATALESAARQRLDPVPYWYVAGAAGSGATARANREAFEGYRLVPRFLRESADRDLSTTLLGTEMSAPVLFAPVGVQSIMHPDGELATARAARDVGVPMVLSTASSHTIEEVAEANGDGARWYQLYWPRDHEFTFSILDRAKRAGFTVLVVTLDTWQLAWRPHDLDHGYLPFIRGVGTAIAFSDPVFQSYLDRPATEDVNAAALTWAYQFTGHDHGWSDLALLREHWDGPILLKGVLHPDDARRALEAGVDGVVVSNHGGRQVDGAIAALDALPAVAEAIGDRGAVLFDSGIRTGSDAIKALALGARAVLIGRPYAYGLACAGQDGVTHVARSLLADLDLTLGLIGCRRPSELGPHVLTQHVLTQHVLR